VETPQTFYKPVEEEPPPPGITFTVDPPDGEVVADKVVEGIHRRIREEGRPIVSMADLCRYEPTFVSDNSKVLSRAFNTTKDLQIFLLTHGYLENFKEDASKNLGIYEMRHKYQTTYGIMSALSQTLNFKFNVGKTNAEYRANLRKRYGVTGLNSEPRKSMEISEIGSRLDRMEQLLKAVASQVEYIHEFTHIKSYD